MIEALRNYAKEYTNGKPYGFNPGLALMIANRMEQLIALAENGQSAIDTNQRLCEKLKMYIDENYYSILPKETLIYNIQYHLLKCNTKEECIECVQSLLDNFEAKHDREDE